MPSAMKSGESAHYSARGNLSFLRAVPIDQQQQKYFDTLSGTLFRFVDQFTIQPDGNLTDAQGVNIE